MRAFKPFPFFNTALMLIAAAWLSQPAEAFEPPVEESNIVWEVEGDQTLLDSYFMLLTIDGDPLLAVANQDVVLDEVTIPQDAILFVISTIPENETDISPNLRGTAQVLYSTDGSANSAQEYFIPLNSIQYIDLMMRPVYPAQ